MMLLSDAILLGSPMSRPGYGPDSIGYIEYETRCALGAAGNAVGLPATKSMIEGGPVLDGRYATILKQWPWLNHNAPPCPRPECMGTAGHSVQELIWHLNDIHRLARAETARYVAQRERERGLVVASIRPADDAVDVVTVG